MKKQGIWDLPLQQIPFPGRSFEVLSMDYNMLANQSLNSTRAPAHNYPAWREQATQAYISGFKRAYETNRAPFFVGNHFEEWNGGIYMDAVEEALKHIARERDKGGDIRMVSFRQFTDWLDVQPPQILAKLRGLEVGQAPAGAGSGSEMGVLTLEGVRKIPGTDMRNFSHECRQPRPPALEPHEPHHRPRPSPRRPDRRRRRERAARDRVRLRRDLGRRRQHQLRHQHGRHRLRGPGERHDAPELSGKTVDGGQLDVDDYRGKVVVLNVWGSWCGPCRAEAKNFEKVYQDTRDQGVQFVGINTRDTSTTAALRFEKEQGVTYPSLYDPSGKLMLRFEKGTLNPQAIPSTLVIDRDGKIAARALQALSEEKLRKMLDPVLAEK